MNLLKTAVILLGTVTVSNLLAPHPLAVFAEGRIQEKLQVATLLETVVQESGSESKPDTDEYIIEKLVEPATGENEPSELTGQMDPGTEQIIIAIRKTWQTGAAAIYLNNQEVMRFRADTGNITPYQRAQVVAQRLYQYLIKEGDLEAIKPATQNGETVIKMGEDVLVTIDEETAKASQNPKANLAHVWTNLVRKSLGAKELPVPQPVTAMAGFVSTGKVQSGQASWYGPGFQGRRTASGTRFNMNEMTAAHRHLPFGTLVKVYNQRTKKVCVVKITDRGPYAHGRIIDLSKAAAQAIDMRGTAPVTLEVVRPATSPTQDQLASGQG